MSAKLRSRKFWRNAKLMFTRKYVNKWYEVSSYLLNFIANSYLSHIFRNLNHFQTPIQFETNLLCLSRRVTSRNRRAQILIEFIYSYTLMTFTQYLLIYNSKSAHSFQDTVFKSFQSLISAFDLDLQIWNIKMFSFTVISIVIFHSLHASPTSRHRLRIQETRRFIENVNCSGWSRIYLIFLMKTIEFKFKVSIRSISDSTPKFTSDISLGQYIAQEILRTDAALFESIESLNSSLTKQGATIIPGYKRLILGQLFNARTEPSIRSDINFMEFVQSSYQISLRLAHLR